MNSVEELQQLEELHWDNLDAEELRSLLENPHVKKALGIIYQGFTDHRLHLVQYNLENPEERAEATKLQGRIQGVEEFLEQLLELAMPEQNEQESNDAT